MPGAISVVRSELALAATGWGDSELWLALLARRAKNPVNVPVDIAPAAFCTACFSPFAFPFPFIAFFSAFSFFFDPES